MKLYDVVKKYGTGKGEATMWESVKYISETLEPMKDAHPDKYWKLVKGVYALINGKHFNEEFGKWQVEQMHFKDKSGGIHKAPYWTDDAIKSVYEAHKSKMNNYPMWDFYVTINMMKADNYCMLKRWYQDATDEELDAKFIEMAINYLNDDDAPNPQTKIWSYFNE